jgi:lipopolysaccharide biosynthesis regulator YciM
LIDILLLLTVAVAIGWWLGRREWHSRRSGSQPGLEHDYLRGLNYLLNQQTDEALDVFIDAFAVNAKTFDTHMALGGVFRRRGEVDKAIQIHQNLMSYKGLSVEQAMVAELELAHDFIKAGLLDRAEELLLDIVVQPSSQQLWATELLIDVYQRERDWVKALAVGKAYAGKGSVVDLNYAMSHYCCELALESWHQNDIKMARSYMQNACQYDDSNARIQLLQAELCISQADYKKAVEWLQGVASLDTQLLPEVIEPLRRCYEKLSDTSGFLQWLQQAMQQSPSASIMIALTCCLRQTEGDFAAGRYLTDQLKQRPSLKGFNYLIDLYLNHASDSTLESLQVLHGLIQALEQSKPVYRCRQCGFAVKSLHWECPGCQQWGTIKPIYGLEGE